jgi:hypothetical protein
MKQFLLASKNFYRNNGLLGLSLSKINQLRAGADDFGVIPRAKLSSQTYSSTPEAPLTSDQIDHILNHDQISDSLKRPFQELREHPMFSDSEKVKSDRLCRSLVAKAKHPFYSKVKSKIPYVIMSPFTFSELARLASFRVAGLASAPLTLPGIIGFSMPCAVTFSMLEMYAPDKFKLPCKCAKWTGGIVFYGLCSSIDYVTAGLETQIFGVSLPLDAPQLMGTLPVMSDIEELQKLKQLADSIIQKSS